MHVAANLSKTLHIKFYQNQSITVEVMTKNFWCFYALQCRWHSFPADPLDL